MTSTATCTHPTQHNIAHPHTHSSRTRAGCPCRQNEEPEFGPPQVYPICHPHCTALRSWSDTYDNSHSLKCTTASHTLLLLLMMSKRHSKPYPPCPVISSTATEPLHTLCLPCCGSANHGAAFFYPLSFARSAATSCAYSCCMTGLRGFIVRVNVPASTLKGERTTCNAAAANQACHVG